MQYQKGFTLIEAIIVLSIVAIIASLAIPIYTQQIVKTRRTAAVIHLFELESKLERYYVEHQTYAGASIIKLNGKMHDDCYRFELRNLNKNNFTVTAIPIGNQLKDDQACGSLSINELGQKQISGTGPIESCF